MPAPKTLGSLLALLVLSLVACSGEHDSTPGDPANTPSPPTGTSPPNHSPVISGRPDTTTVLIGAPWSFQPSASDTDGDALTFSILHKPGWLNFDTRTGRLSGTPATSDVGRHEGIVISVSDGKYNASLPAFTLTVVEPQPVTGSATVSWTPPTQRVDGTAIASISHYTVYYSRNPSQLDQLIKVNAGLTRYVIENLEEGTWYFAVTATCDQGLESAKSATASKTIR